MRTRKLFLPLVVILLMVLALSASAWATDSLGPGTGGIKGTFKYPNSADGITYYEVKMDNSNSLVSNVPTQLVAVGNQYYFNSLSKNARDIWFAIGATAYMSKFGTLATETSKNERYLDIDDKHAHYLFGGKALNVYDNGQMSYARNMGNAYQAMRNEIIATYKADAQGGSRNDLSEDDRKKIVAAELVGVSDSTEGGHAIYYWRGGFMDKSNTDSKGHYVVLGVILDNFKLTPILPDQTGYSIDAKESGITSNYVSGTQNEDPHASITATQNLTTSVTETLSNSIEKTNSYSTTNSVDVSLALGLEIRKGIAQFSAELTTTYGFSAEETFSSAVSETETLSKQSSLSNSMAVVLPPHTEVLLRQSTGDLLTTVSYDAPVYYSYDVTLVVFTLDPGKASSADPKSEVLAKFSGAGGAAEDFAERFLQGQAGDTNLIDWSTGISNLQDRNVKLAATADDAALIDLNNVLALTKPTSGDNRATSPAHTAMLMYRPMSISNGTINYTASGTTNKVERIQPLHPLAETRVPDHEGERKMLVGDYVYVDYLSVEGFNAYGAPFYGFDKRKGSWQLVDGDGEALTDSDTAALEYDSLTGLTKLVATGAGTVYLKYVIDDETYAVPTYDSSYGEDYTVQEELDQFAVIKFVIRTGTASKVEIQGELDGPVGDWILIEDYLDRYVYDVTDFIFETDAIGWQAQGGTTGIEVKEEDGQWYVRFNQLADRDGEYQLRAVYQGVNAETAVYSAWHEVQAIAARQLDELKFLHATSIVATTLPHQMVLADLEDGLLAYDQYGDEMQLSELTDIVWYVDNVEAEIADGVSGEYLELPAYGDYTLHAQSQGVASNKVKLELQKEAQLIGEYFILEAGPHGSIGCSLDAQVEELPQGYPAIIYATADTNYRVQRWLVDGKVWLDDQGTPYRGDTLALEVGPTTQTVRVTFEPALAMKYDSASLSLTGDIAINYYTIFELTENAVPGILFFKGYEPSAKQIQASYDNDEGLAGELVDGKYRFTYADIAAKEMQDSIYSVLFVTAQNGEVFFGEPMEYSVVRYAERVLALSSTKATLKTLCVDMLNYGAAAQAYFNYNTRNLANANLTPAQQALGTTRNVTPTNNSREYTTGLTIDPNIAWVSASLTLESKISINYYGKVLDDSNVTAVYLLSNNSWKSGQDFDISTADKVQMQFDGNLYSGSINDIVAKNMEGVYYSRLCVKYQDGSYGYSSIRSYSVESYASLVAGNANSSANLKKLVQMMANYGNSAKIYFNAL